MSVMKKQEQSLMVDVGLQIPSPTPVKNALILSQYLLASGASSKLRFLEVGSRCYFYPRYQAPMVQMSVVQLFRLSLSNL